MQERQFFSNTDLKALIISLIIEQILVMLVSMADTMMVSHAGEAAISGVSLVDMINGVKVAVLGLVVGRLFCSILFSVWMGFGIIGMWLAMATHWIFNSVFGYIRFKNGKWKHKRIIG